jgi:hypothetical protein
MVVVSAYQQMRNQKEPVLSELGEDNFDSAFSFFKPGKLHMPLSCSDSQVDIANLVSTLQSFKGPQMPPKNSPSRILTRPLGFFPQLCSQS